MAATTAFVHLNSPVTIAQCRSTAAIYPHALMVVRVSTRARALTDATVQSATQTLNVRIRLTFALVHHVRTAAHVSVRPALMYATVRLATRASIVRTQ
jgi:hypothetical protein